MAIEVNSAAWTGNEDRAAGAPQVCGAFHDREKLDEALSRLEGSLFQRADLSVRVPGREDDAAYSGTETPVREDDARNLRTLGTSTAAAGIAMGAAGLVIATGGAALPAVAAAAAAGGATIAAGEAAGAAATPGGKAAPQQAAEQSAAGAVLMVHADTPEKQSRAEEIMQACGATRVWRQGGV